MNVLRVVLAGLFGAIAAACDRPPQQEPASDFAVLAQAAEGYTRAEKGRVPRFPEDHGAHPDYRIEWWYLTANLQDAKGRAYGAQWTLFRTAVSPPDPVEPPVATQHSQIYMAHFALTWPDGHTAFQRYARGEREPDESRAGVIASPFAAWLDDWSLHSTSSGWLPLKAQARQESHKLELSLDSDRPLVLQGEQGFSQKHPQGGGSYYYSQPFLQAAGELTIGGESVAVSGRAWLDHEWSSQFLQPDQAGWDWFALHLESGEKLMLFRLRQHESSQQSNYRHGVLISPEGISFALEPSLINFRVLETEMVAGRALPLYWKIELPEIGREVEVRATHPDQWMEVDFPYWEGSVTVSGKDPGSRGVGYLELTGYPVK
ncbi:MAG: iron ABC transporter permease [Xanthomonadales bacterium]|nr:iron ABC transporter permease [Gammaproteobacteria bacterium]NND57495.1 iron ABC transporter permease [Xanthomonadales bacterium]NNK51219.1 iron ABC transporter permease [Xanthomonadales bacterium]